MDVFELEYFNKQFENLHQHIDASMNRIMQGESPVKIESIPTPPADFGIPTQEEPVVPKPTPAPAKRGRKPAAGQTPFPIIPPISAPTTPSAALAPQEIETLPFDSDLAEKARIDALRKEHGIKDRPFNPETEVMESDGTIHIMDDLSDQTLAQVAPLFVEISNKIGRDVAMALIKEHTGEPSLKSVKPEQYTKLYHIFKKAYHNACQADSLTI